MDVVCIAGSHALMGKDGTATVAVAFVSGSPISLSAQLSSKLIATTDNTFALANGNLVELHDCSTGRQIVALPLKSAPVLLALGEKVMAAITVCDGNHVMSVMYLTAESAGLVQDIPVPADVTAVAAREAQAAVLVGHKSGLVAEYILRASTPPTVRAATSKLLNEPPVVLVDDGAGGVITATDSTLELWHSPEDGALARCTPHAIVPGILGVVKGEHSAWLRYAGHCQQLGTTKRRRVICNGARGATIINERLIVCTMDNRLGTVKCFV